MLIYDIIFLSLHEKSDVSTEKIETLYAVVTVSVDAYSHFDLTKYKYYHRKKNGDIFLFNERND